LGNQKKNYKCWWIKSGQVKEQQEIGLVGEDFNGNKVVAKIGQVGYLNY